MLNDIKSLVILKSDFISTEKMLSTILLQSFSAQLEREILSSGDKRFFFTSLF